MKQKIALLKKYFQKRDDILMAFLFGSRAKGLSRGISDWDIGIYFKSESGEVEWEKLEKEFLAEEKIRQELTELLKTDNIDLIILNRAPAHLAATVVTKGMPLIIKDYSVFLNFMLIVTREAEDYRAMVHDYYTIYERSSSLADEDRVNLEKRITFLSQEIKDTNRYNNILRQEYENDRYKKRELERWIENIVNASLDIAKIILASEKKHIPETYKEVFLAIGSISPFSKELGENLTRWTDLRNILAHEYLDIRWARISKFFQVGVADIEQFFELSKEFLNENNKK